MREVYCVLYTVTLLRARGMLCAVCCILCCLLYTVLCAVYCVLCAVCCVLCAVRHVLLCCVREAKSTLPTLVLHEVQHRVMPAKLC